MKKKKHNHSKRVMALVVMSFLVFGSLGSTTVLAAESDMPIQGWDRLVGSNLYDDLCDVIATEDGNFVSAGSQGSDAMLVKTNPQGTIIWKKIVHGSGDDAFSSVTELDDGSLIAVGYSSSSTSGDITDSNNGTLDGLLVKFSANGDKLWDKLMGGSHYEEFKGIIATKDGGFLAVGYSRSSAEGEIIDANNGAGVATSDGYIVKFNSTGTVQWDNLFGSAELDLFFNVIQTSDGGFIATGSAVDVSNDGIHTNSGGEITDSPATSGDNPHDGLLVKFDASGHMVWNKLFGSDDDDDFYGITATTDGGCVVVGKTFALNGDITTGEVSNVNTALVVKFDKNGQSVWNRAFTGGGSPLLMDVKPAPDGSFYVAGFTFFGSNYAIYDGILAKISASGSVLGIETFNGENVDTFLGLVVDPRGHLIVAGSTTSSLSGDLQSVSNGWQDGLLVYYGFDPELFSIVFDENGGSTVPDQVIAYGNKVTTPAESLKSGYTFAGWFANSSFSERFALNAPIIQDATLYAKWYHRVMVNSITSTDRSVSGIGQPGFTVAVTLPSGTKIETSVASDRKWSIQLPKEYQLKAGEKITATMYDIFSDGVEVSSDQRTVAAGVTPPKTGDVGVLIPACLLMLLLSITVMVGIRLGTKTVQ